MNTIPLTDLQGAEPVLSGEPEPPPFSEDAIASAFANNLQSHLRYVAAFGHWMLYDGKRWARENTLFAFDMARLVCRDFAGRAENNRVAKLLTSAATVAAVERMARADRALAATAEQWDADPWLLNTPSGVIDLSLGANFGHSPEYYMTKITGAPYHMASATPCPIWNRFLDRITGGDVELQAFLKRVCGYLLTGSTREHALFFFYGTGGNGKSVFLNTIAGILGDYAQTAQAETFTANAFDRHPTDIASLRGARLVTAIETEEGRAWAEARIKSLTGGDRISARFIRQDPFEFKPEFKLVIAGNHKPSLRNVDEAIRRRFHLIPFIVTIPPEERDLNLGEKLKDEWPGILKWMVEGCLEWQRLGGLKPPKAVVAATEAYLEAEDSIANWITDECTIDPNATEQSKALFASWKRWAEAAGEQPGSQKRFKQAMENRGHECRHTNTGSKFAGIMLTPKMTGHYGDD